VVWFGLDAFSSWHTGDGRRSFEGTGAASNFVGKRATSVAEIFFKTCHVVSREICWRLL